MKVLIIEDEIIQNENLAKIIEENYSDIEVFRAYSCKDTKKIMKEDEIDIFLVDVNLPDGSGIELIKEIRKIKEYELKGVIFITSEKHKIVDAFKNTHCYDFLVKPYNGEDVRKIIDIFYRNSDKKTYNERKYSIIPIDNNVTFKVYHEDIIFVEYNFRQCIVHTSKNEIVCKRLSLSQVFKEIASETIVQAHKSYIVNTTYISKIEKEYRKLWTIKFSKTEKIAKASVNYFDNILKALEKNR